MGRCKKYREYSIKPEIKSFAPCCKKPTQTIELNHDELEAIFLMDFQDLYQEDAAKMMNISRPTLSRIIKSARFKIASTLINGAKLHINDEKKDFIVAFCSEGNEEFLSMMPKQKYLHFYSINETQITYIKSIENPIYQTSERPSKIFPNILKKEGVNFFLAHSIGEGLKNSLLAQGIHVKEVQAISSLHDIQKLFN